MIDDNTSYSEDLRFQEVIYLARRQSDLSSILRIDPDERTRGLGSMQHRPRLR